MTSLGSPEADAILTTYRSAFDGIDLTEPVSGQSKYHFIVRLWRITGAEEWRMHESLARHLDETGTRLLEATRVAELGGGDNVADWDAGSGAFLAACGFVPKVWIQSGQSALRLNHSDGPQSGTVQPPTMERVHIWYLMSLLMALQKLVDHRLELHPNFADASSFAKQILKSSAECLDPQRPGFQQLLLDDPVKAVNCMCRARRLSIVPRRWLDETWAAYQRGWTAQRRSQQMELYIYGLTHFILDSTDFYQMRIDLELFCKSYDIISKIDSGSIFREILQYFEDQADAILQLADPDLIAEVGLCFRVCGRDCSSMCQRCVEFVSSMVRFCSLEQRVLLYKPNRSASRGLKREEHLNCVGLLLLSSWPKSFFPGPRYSKEEADALLASVRVATPPALAPEVPALAVQRPSSLATRLKAGLTLQKSRSQAQLTHPQLATVETYGDKRKRLQLLGIISNAALPQRRQSRTSTSPLT